MGLLYVLFSKAVPIISVWELKVGTHLHPHVGAASAAAAAPDRSAELWRVRS